MKTSPPYSGAVPGEMESSLDLVLFPEQLGPSQLGTLSLEPSPGLFVPDTHP